MSAIGRVPAIALPTQSPASSPEPQTHITLTLATAVAVALAISVTFFLLGLLCGWMWGRRQGRRY